MVGLFIQDEEGIAQIITQRYGCSFKTNIYDINNDIYVEEGIASSEVIEPVDSFSTDTSNNQNQGDTDIVLDDVTGLVTSDRLKIGSYIYYIKNIVNNTITITELLETLSAGTDVSRVGNLGIYNFRYTFSELGIYTLIAKDTVYGLNTSQIIKVQPKSIETMVRDIKNLEYAILGS